MLLGILQAETNAQQKKLEATPKQTNNKNFKKKKTPLESLNI